jgi:hypothetical protein
VLDVFVHVAYAIPPLTCLAPFDILLNVRTLGKWKEDINAIILAGYWHTDPRIKVTQGQYVATMRAQIAAHLGNRVRGLANGKLGACKVKITRCHFNIMSVYMAWIWFAV